MPGIRSFLLLALLVSGSCTGFEPPSTGSTASAGLEQAAPGSRPKIVALGDSLTAGLGLPRRNAYPAVLQRRLEEKGYRFEVVNAGVSGDTTAGGLRRLNWVIDGDVRILILALGANDGLRGVPVAETRKNLTAIIQRTRARGVKVLLTGMEAPPNFGLTYTAAYRRLFRDLAAQYSLPFVPFLLEGVAGVPALNQADGIHPTAAGARIMADHVWAVLEPMIDQADP